MIHLLLALACTDAPGPVDSENTSSDTSDSTDTSDSSDSSDSGDTDDSQDTGETPEICDNDVDDDGDTLIDCNDPDCFDQDACQDAMSISATLDITTAYWRATREPILEMGGSIDVSATPLGEGTAFECEGNVIAAAQIVDVEGCEGCVVVGTLSLTPFWAGSCPVGDELPTLLVGVEERELRVMWEQGGAWEVFLGQGVGSFNDVEGGFEATLTKLEQVATWTWIDDL